MTNPIFKFLHTHTSYSRTSNIGFGLANLKGKLRGWFSSSKNEKILKELAEVKSNQIKILENQNRPYLINPRKLKEILDNNVKNLRLRI